MLAGQPRAVTGGLARAYAALVVALRWPILLGWLFAAVAAVLYLPPLAASSGQASLVPPGSPAVRAEATATKIFGEPLDAQVAVVQRDPRGLSTGVLAAAVHRAVDLDTGHPVGGPISGLAGAVPIPDSARLFPFVHDPGTTIVTFLYFQPDTSFAAQTAGGQQYASRNAGDRGDHLVGVTGVVPATYDQGVIIQQRLPWVESATVAAIAVIVGYFFLSAGAPLATLLCAATAYLIAVRVVAWVMLRMHVTLPPDVEPVLVVLLLGVTTDYSVFFLSGMRRRLAEGLPRLAAARLTTAEFAPIILAAGVLVAAGTASLGVAGIQLISAFGPALALTVLIAMLVSLTLAPALIASFGSALFLPGPAWYWRARRAARAVPSGGRAVPSGGRAVPSGGRGALPDGRIALPDGRIAPPAGRAASSAGRTASLRRAARLARPAEPGARTLRERVARFATARPVALLIVAGCVLGLLATALTARDVRLGSPLIGELPAGSQPVRAADAASDGFTPGILAPTEVLVLGRGVDGKTAPLARLQHELDRIRGVAGVVGPASLPALLRLYNPMLAKSGNAARYAVIERTDPLGSTAVDRIELLQASLPRLVRNAGLAGERVEVGGETAAIGDAITSTTASLGRLAVLMLAITAVLLTVFLRALIAPLYLLVASVLALAATLGVTVWVFQVRLGYDSLVYYVPFTVAVLLVSLGADYNVFVVGRIWEEARQRPLRDAIAVAGSEASRAITVAGIALASSFALLALIPLAQFREVSLAMAAGIAIDTVVVRSLMVPALVALFGRAGMWPGGAGRVREPARARSPQSQKQLW